jgi:hypothetical protein
VVRAATVDSVLYVCRLSVDWLAVSDTHYWSSLLVVVAVMYNTVECGCCGCQEAAGYLPTCCGSRCRLPRWKRHEYGQSPLTLTLAILTPSLLRLLLCWVSGHLLGRAIDSGGIDPCRSGIRLSVQRGLCRSDWRAIGVERDAEHSTATDARVAGVSSRVAGIPIDGWINEAVGLAVQTVADSCCWW